MNTDGYFRLSRLITKQMTVETTHWNQDMNSGAPKLTVSLLNRCLFTKTVKIEVTLKILSFRIMIAIAVSTYYSPVQCNHEENLQVFVNQPVVLLQILIHIYLIPLCV